MPDGGRKGEVLNFSLALFRHDSSHGGASCMVSVSTRELAPLAKVPALLDSSLCSRRAC